MGKRNDGHETGKRNAYLSGRQFNLTTDLRTGTSYEPADGVVYDAHTTLKGVMEKEDPGNWEFVVPQKLKELYKARDYGRYGKNGEMPVCFIVNTDNTGGNSGSPVFNSKGQLVAQLSTATMKG